MSWNWAKCSALTTCTIVISMFLENTNTKKLLLLLIRKYSKLHCGYLCYVSNIILHTTYLSLWW